MADFELFKSEFKKWQFKFGLSGYSVYFKYEPIESSFASIKLNQSESVATVTLNSELSKDAVEFKDIEGAAKHEAIHMLLGRLEFLADSRFIRSDEIYEEVESLAHRLEEVIT